jgi:hypothetical protein
MTIKSSLKGEGMNIRQIDWWDVTGIFLTYAGLAMFALTIVYKESDLLLNLLLIGLAICFSLLTLFWKKFRWGFQGAFMLIGVQISGLFCVIILVTGMAHFIDILKIGRQKNV